MRLAAFVLMACLAASAAHGGEAMTGAEAEAMLNGATAWYLPLGPQSARQYFDANGQTSYIDAAGTRTSGLWLMRGDQYCSLWPPSDQYRCYGVEKTVAEDGTPTITFTSGASHYEAVLKQGAHIDEPWGG